MDKIILNPLLAISTWRHCMLYVVVALVGVVCGVVLTLVCIGVLYRILLKAHVEAMAATYNLITKLAEDSVVKLNTTTTKFMDISTREPPPLPSRSSHRTMWDALEEKRRKHVDDLAKSGGKDNVAEIDD